MTWNQYEKLREQILEELSTQREMEEENTYVNTILETILEDAEVKYPPQMVENEIDGEVRGIRIQIKSPGNGFGDVSQNPGPGR